MKDAKVSIIVPVYNGENYLGNCIDSILNQTYQRLEILLVNDGSTDDTDQICNKYAKKDDRITYFAMPHMGQGSARNCALQNATGEYLCFVDADDMLTPDSIEQRLKLALQKDADIVICNFIRDYIIDGERKQYLEYSRVIDQKAMNAKENKAILTETETFLWDKFFKRDLWEKCKMNFTDSYGEDIAVVKLLLARADTIAFMNQPFYIYRMHEENLTANIDKVMSIFDSLQLLLDVFRKYDLWQVYQEQLEEIIFYQGYCWIQMQRYMLSPEQTRDFREKMTCLIEKNFPQFDKYRQLKQSDYIVWGSYNTRKVASICGDDSCRVIRHYEAESLISAYSKQGMQYHVSHSNHYRERAVQDNLNHLFAKHHFMEKAQFLFIDLLNESFDVFSPEEGSWITNSFYLQEARIMPHLNTQEGAVMKLQEPKRLVEWQRCCDQFVKDIEVAVQENGIQVILLEHYLATEYGSTKDCRKYNNYEEICAKNRQLEILYQYLKEQLTVPYLTINENQRADNFSEERGLCGYTPIDYNEKFFFREGYEVMKRLHGIER